MKEKGDNWTSLNKTFAPQKITEKMDRHNREHQDEIEYVCVCVYTPLIRQPVKKGQHI